MRGTHRSLLVLAFALILATSSALLAQATPPPPTCPPKALLSIARAGAACVNLEAGSACYGSGLVTSTQQTDSASPGLVQLGDRVPLRDLTSVTVSPTGTDQISMTTLTIRSLSGANGVMTMLLIGDARVDNLVTDYVEQVMQPTASLNLREAPADDAPILATLGVNNRVVANGYYEDWLRVIVPATGQTAWISASLLSGDTSRLPKVDPLVPFHQPFAQIELWGGDNRFCGGMLPAGVLLQTPSTDFQDAVPLLVENGLLNRSALLVAGTVFITGDRDRSTLFVLDGVARLDSGDTQQFIPAGSAISPGSSFPAPYDVYDESLLAALPINNLPRRFSVTPPLTQAAIDARIAELSAPPPTPVPTIAVPDNACRRSIGRLTTVWSGPGEDYEALTRLDAGTAIRPVLTTTDTSGAEWWQLADSGWVARENVVQRGDCPSVPAAERVAAPPTNTYSLERCASTDGPVRAGQSVTFEFTPPAWDNLGEARAATSTDPGHFTLNAERYYAHASQPFRLGAATDPLEDRYLRRFTLTWTAQPGTYRVTGDWLSYEPSCNLTVPVE